MSLTHRPLFPLVPQADPAEEARQLHTEGGLVPVRLPGDVAAWAAVDHTTAQLVLGHPELTKDAAYWPDLASGRVPDHWELIAVIRGAGMLHAGGDDHRRLRKLASSAFTRAPIAALEGRITEIAGQLLDDLAAADPREPVDLRDRYAYRLPVRVICEVLGVPDTAVSGLRGAFERLVTPQEDGAEDIRVAQAEIHRSLTALIAAKRAAPGDDLTSALIQARDDGDRLSEEELVETLFLILIAGHETTLNLISSAVHALLEHPDKLAYVRDAARNGDGGGACPFAHGGRGARTEVGADDGSAVTEADDADDDIWTALVDETLRYSSPVRHALMRYAVEDVDIAGVRVSRGEPVLAGLFAAGRDPGRHTDPDVFDPARPTRRDHLAFGHGAHYCLGARLARLEARIALKALFTRYPDLEAAAAPERLASISVQGVRTLPVRLNAGRPRG
ncbi:cytochrome P450 family protein [Streptomyces chrestomyceticus]|uniref:cytochrome P450 family protein n=1 Tax=Streptomyces chrestomyceticus TaxID=68185 RepID=UPI0019D00C9E|nr:cytochrome P450 [Streptomyces chrestomyceticus]